MVKFNTSREEAEITIKIARRASKLAHSLGIEYSTLEADMDITATHSNGTPMKLAELLAANDSNFSHDVFGIRRHINRRTGRLENCFLPRYAV